MLLACVLNTMPLFFCAGVDPKSIVCEYFRAGQCTKGFKCKFSHDLAVERKGGKIDLFTDTYEVHLHRPSLATMLLLCCCCCCCHRSFLSSGSL